MDEVHVHIEVMFPRWTGKGPIMNNKLSKCSDSDILIMKMKHVGEGSKYVT